MGTTVGRPQSLKQGWDHLMERDFGLSPCELRAEALPRAKGRSVTLNTQEKPTLSQA